MRLPRATPDGTTLVTAGDPIGTGLVASLARPGGNITGLSNLGSEAAGKCVELFRDMLASLAACRSAEIEHSRGASSTSLAQPAASFGTEEHCSSGNTMTSSRSFDTSIPPKESIAIFVSLSC